MRMVGRLRVANHGTEDKPTYVVLGLISPQALEALGVDRVGDEAALFDVRECMGEISLKYAGPPIDSGYGHTFNEVWRKSPDTFRTPAEAELGA